MCQKQNKNELQLNNNDTELVFVFGFSSVFSVFIANISESLNLTLLWPFWCTCCAINLHCMLFVYLFGNGSSLNFFDCISVFVYSLCHCGIYILVI